MGANDGQNYFNEVNPSTGAVTTYPTTVNPYNVHIDSAGTTVWMDGDGIVGLASVPLSPSVGSATTVALTGDDSYVNALMFLPGDSTHAYYTSDTGSRFAGTQGHVGIVNLQTGVTTCFKTSGSCTLFYGVHGGTYDPYTGDLIVFGADEINQITLTGALCGPRSGALAVREHVRPGIPGWLRTPLHRLERRRPLLRGLRDERDNREQQLRFHHDRWRGLR